MKVLAAFLVALLCILASFTTAEVREKRQWGPGYYGGHGYHGGPYGGYGRGPYGRGPYGGYGGGPTVIKKTVIIHGK